MSLKALIFDVDGTISNTERDAHLFAFNQAFEQLGIDWNWSNELYHQLLKITGGKERIKHYINDYLTDFDTRPVADTITDFAIKLHAQKTQNFIDIIDKGDLPLRIGIERIFNEAKQRGLRLAIATTTTYANVEAIIGNTLGKEWLDNFEVIGAGDVVANKKPAGDIYKYVLDKMGLSPDEAIAFEDSENGIRSATDAGLQSIITVNEYTTTHNFEGALVVLDNLGEEHTPFEKIKGRDTQHTFVTIDYVLELYAQNH
jgi:HAD superfamily hydrolase (TIGR01509 family)